MISVTCRRPFSELGDQQLLEQTRRLAANQRCLEVHILDHLDEIDRRGLALRRGFSSLFDYAVRELRFTDAAAQRRIQAMRLCRRHGWVRASLQSGELSMTSAAQLETTFAGAERAERQCHTGRRNVGQGRCRDQEKDDDPSGRTEQLGLPAARSEAGERGERGPRSAPELAPPAEQCAGDAAAANAPVMPVASHAVAQNPGAGHAGALLPRPELNGNAAPFPAPSCAPVAIPVAGLAAPSSDEGPAPQLLPPADLSASASASAPVLPVAAPSESLHTASRVPESSRDDPFAELSPGPLSAAPLLHPQRQRELIEQAAGMSTRQVAVLLAAAAPEVVPPRDTLRAVAPDRYTLKVTIDQECEQGLRRLKGLRSHLDPRMSWGDLVARLVCEALERYDPLGGGNGHRRRRSAGSAGASPRRAPNKTCATGAAAGPAQRANESSRRTPKRTRAAGAPAAPAQRGGGATPAPQGDTAAAERQNPSAMLANAAPPSQSVPAAPLDGARAGGAPSPAALRPPLLRRRSSRPTPWRMAPMPAPPCRARRSPLRRRSRYSACPLTADRATHQPGQRRTRPAILSTTPTNPRHGATFPRLSGATSGNATEDAAVIAIRSPGAAAPLPICCRSTTCCRSPRAVARSRTISSCRALLITACATATGRLRRRSPRCSASSALLSRRSTAPADGSQVARPAHTSQRRAPRVHLRCRLIRPWPVAVDALVQGVVVVSLQRIRAASGVRTRPDGRSRRLTSLGERGTMTSAGLNGCR